MEPTTEASDTTEVAAPPVEVSPASDNVKSIESAKQPKMNKHQQRQVQKYIDRLRRHMARGINEQQARQLIAKEDYDNLSPEKKIVRLEALLSNVVNMVQQDINNLRHNDGELAFAMDVNFRAFAKILAKLGVGIEEQQVMLAEAEVEVKAEEVKRKEEAAKKQQEAQAAAQKAQEAAVLEEAKEPATEPAEPQETPEGATEFSG